MHGREPLAQLVEVELAMVGMQSHGHIGDLAPTHARTQKMVKGMVESEEHHELFRGDGDLGTFEIDPLGMFD